MAQCIRCVICDGPIDSGLRCAACCQRAYRQRVKDQNPKLSVHCVECSTEFIQTDPRRIYCSGKCTKRASVRRLKTCRPAYTICEGCGRKLSRNRYCNDVCKHRAYRRRRLNNPAVPTVPCVECGVSCPARRWGTVSFCRTCAQRRFRQEDQLTKDCSTKVLLSSIQCVDCQCLFTKPSISGTTPLRCSICADSRTRSRNMHWSGKTRAQIWHARFEEIDPWVVFEDDKWVCGICGDLVNPQLHKPDPMSPSLDHIIPLSRGGDHVRNNVQLAHLLCNVRKHNKITS